MPQKQPKNLIFNTIIPDVKEERKIIYPSIVCYKEKIGVYDECIATIKEDYIELNVSIDGAGNTFRLYYDKIRRCIK